MILETWQIKVLEHFLLDYNEWLDDACCRNVNFDRNELPEEIRDFEFTEMELAIQYKIYIRLRFMLKEYELNNGKFDEFLTNEQKINIITSQEGYKNRVERDEEDR